MTVIVAALVGFLTGRMLWLAMRKSWNRQPLLRKNYQGVTLPTAAGIVLALTLVAVEGARQLLIFGTGTGKSSEMEQFVVWLNVHHPDLADRIIGTVVVDERHLTESQLLAKAREFYATPLNPVNV